MYIRKIYCLMKSDVLSLCRQNILLSYFFAALVGHVHLTFPYDTYVPIPAHFVASFSHKDAEGGEER